MEKENNSKKSENLQKEVEEIKNFGSQE